jgi:hypothetical protein
MVRAPNQGARGYPPVGRDEVSVMICPARSAGSGARYFAPVAAAYFLRNLSTRPAVSTIFCLPV